MSHKIGGDNKVPDPSPLKDLVARIDAHETIRLLKVGVKVDDDEEPAPEVVDPSGERSSLDNESQGTSLENQQQIHTEISRMMEHVPHKTLLMVEVTCRLPRRSVTSAVTLGPIETFIGRVQMMMRRPATDRHISPLSHNDQVKDRHSIDDHHSHRQNHDALNGPSLGR
ncbi:hypothetical protein HAX54_035171 [Datura stramonium]|uniref:Uncharacterized protein n=1 Tax=Datura stramonium TaxID=4076 RepID=A0ABS8VGF3_DATST|nr:hypothetical protein [Datura stramonium]